MDKTMELLCGMGKEILRLHRRIENELKSLMPNEGDRLTLPKGAAVYFSGDDNERVYALVGFERTKSAADYDFIGYDETERREVRVRGNKDKLAAILAHYYYLNDYCGLGSDETDEQ